MKVRSECMYIGYEKGESREGKPWLAIGLLQGIESEKIYVNEEVEKIITTIKPMSTVVADLRITIKADKTCYINVDNITPVAK